MSDWKEAIKHDAEYSDYIILDNPAPFNEMYANRDIPRVQLYSTQVFTVDGVEHIVGFCGVFEWKNNEIIPLDGDSYSDKLHVLGYEEDENCLCILVGNDW